jgi:hypothetical protein
MGVQGDGSHPLSDRRILDKVVVGLSRQAPEDAIADLLPWIESLNERAGSDLAGWAGILFELDEAARLPVFQCTDMYLGDHLTSAACRHSLAALMNAYGSALLGVYGVLLSALTMDSRLIQDRGFVAKLALRAIQSGFLCVKWNAFRHGPLDEKIWGQMNRAYRLASRLDATGWAVRLGPHSEICGTVEEEYCRAIAFHSVGLDQMEGDGVEVAARLVNYVLRQLELSRTPTPTAVCWIDAALSSPPTRMVQPPLHAALPRYFLSETALDVLLQLSCEVAVGNSPPGLVRQFDLHPERLDSVLSHLTRVWSNAAPMRRHRRHAMPGRLRVVDGMNSLLCCLQGDHDVFEMHNWAVRDVSLHGLGMDARDDDLDSIKVGSLVGVHALEGDHWRVGAVRRMWRCKVGFAQIGIELLGETPICAEADDGTRRMSVLVLDPLCHGNLVRLILPLSEAGHDGPLYVFDQQCNAHKLMPTPEIEYGVDHKIRAFHLSLI